MKLVGYGAVFYNPGDPGSEYQLTPSVRERIAPSAFDRALNGKDDVVAAFNHDLNFLLGRRSAGTLTLATDSRGLRYEIDYNENDPHHVSVAEKIKRGYLIGSSFSFAPIEEKIEATGSGYIRTILEVKLYEVGPVWAAAYPSTTTGIRSLATPGSVRWVAETPGAARRLERARQIEREIVLDRMDQLQRDEVSDRLRYVEVCNNL